MVTLVQQVQALVRLQGRPGQLLVVMVRTVMALTVTAPHQLITPQPLARLVQVDMAQMSTVQATMAPTSMALAKLQALAMPTKLLVLTTATC